jgi:flagellar hook-associated protein FlgK
MTLMLELERTYQASGKLMSTIDSMLGMLLATVG